ncbi:universal stress protein [Paenibacillus puerhi]|uniref:universal stress protein n=1 Tax=Paenibacillus puerhi TaxID=2692622 RepID=UPI00135A05C7|nr:universal stress protein [Paenibacillus puerhi]
MYANILVAYDGSEISERALEAGARLAALTPEAKLQVLHVFYWPTLVIGDAFIAAPPARATEEYEYTQALEEKAREHAAKFGASNIEVTTLQGSPAKVILEYAVTTAADVIVIGSRGLSGIGEFVLGSVSHNVVQHARVPVLVVK